MRKKQVLIILGPTSSGKTDIGLIIAKKLSGELVSFDSRQVYQGLDIGTGKEASHKFKVKKSKGVWEINGVKVWMYDVVSPGVQYDVSRFVKDSNKVIEDILGRGKLPILVGGTGLYLKGLTQGLFNLRVPLNKKLRRELEELSLGELKERLRKVSDKTFQEMNSSDGENPRRLIRKIEILETEGSPLPQGYLLHSSSALAKEQGGSYEFLKIGLFADREVLNERIDERVLKRLDQGMVEESEELLKNKKITLGRMKKLGLEYGVLADFLTGKISSREELIQVLQSKIHQYAKRQMTWFKKEKSVFWFDITSKDYMLRLEKRVRDWYN